MSDIPVRVFISYARSDIRHLEELRSYAADLAHNGVKFFDDRVIPPGHDFERTLYGYLDQADVVVLLLTQNYISSDYCIKVELPRAVRNMKMGKCRVLPLNVDKFYITPGSALSSMQWTPSGESISERSAEARKKAWIDAAWTLYQYVEAQSAAAQQAAGTSGSMCAAAEPQDQGAIGTSPKVTVETEQARGLRHLGSAERTCHQDGNCDPVRRVLDTQTGRLLTAGVIALLALLVALWPRFSHDMFNRTPRTVSVSISCDFNSSPHPDAKIELAYHINSADAIRVALGAGIYDSQGNDHSTGFGDIDNIEAARGRSTKTRPVLIPADLPRGTYELDAEIWPANKIGQNGTNDITDARCGFLTVP